MGILFTRFLGLVLVSLGVGGMWVFIEGFLGLQEASSYVEIFSLSASTAY